MATALGTGLVVQLLLPERAFIRFSRLTCQRAGAPRLHRRLPEVRPTLSRLAEPKQLLHTRPRRLGRCCTTQTTRRWPDSKWPMEAWATSRVISNLRRQCTSRNLCSRYKLRDNLCNSSSKCSSRCTRPLRHLSIRITQNLLSSPCRPRPSPRSTGLNWDRRDTPGDRSCPWQWRILLDVLFAHTFGTPWFNCGVHLVLLPESVWQTPLAPSSKTVGNHPSEGHAEPLRPGSTEIY